MEKLETPVILVVGYQVLETGEVQLEAQWAEGAECWLVVVGRLIV